LNEGDLNVSADVRGDPDQEGAAVLIGDDSPTPSSSATLESSAPHSADEPEAGWLLLAEDNPINQKVAVAMLSSAGYRVDTVLNGREAVVAAGKHPYDAILMDCQMPELNGYEATAAIRAGEGVTRHTPIIALTAGTRAEDRERCLVEGMDSYLAKPLNKDALVGMVTDAMAQDPHRDDPFGTTARRSDDETALDQAAFQELQQLGHVVESTFLVDLVEAFVEDTASLVMQLRNAHEGGDILAVMQIAHSIKGSSSQLGGRRLAEACAQLIRHPAAESERGMRDVEEDFQELRYTLRRQLSLDGQEDPGYSRV
jgi:CheY-like chemotaxis protein